MTKKSQIKNDEIDLIDLMYIVWRGKRKVAAAVVISLIALISFQLINANKFNATTEIKQIKLIENKYAIFNNTGFIDADIYETLLATYNKSYNKSYNNYEDFKITSKKLYNIYIDILNDKSIFEDAIHKFNLIDASQYDSDQEYNEAVIILASTINILPPLVKNRKIKDKDSESSYYTINFIYDDFKKWKNVLLHVDRSANILVKKFLVEKYQNSLLLLKKKKMSTLEDISLQIKNLVIDYERKTFDRILYLEEQSEIAKTLGIAKNTIVVQSFGNAKALLSNFQTESPFYLRGYEAIDKEIELIQSRDAKNAFIEGLFKLEQDKRAIEQDKTIERIESILQSVLISDKDFSAASLNTYATKFEYKNNIEMLVIAIIIGLIAGIFYAIISNSFQSFRVSKKN